MTPLGRSLVFYLRYPAEMRALYEKRDEGDYSVPEGVALPPSLRDPEEMVRKVHAVAEKASAQGGGLLKRVAGGIVEHFSRFCNAKVATHDARIEGQWLVDIRLWPRLPRRPKRRWRWSVWISLEPDENPPAITTGFWARGGLRGEDELARILGRRVKTRSSEHVDWARGCVGLGNVSIPGLDKPGYDIDADPLVEKTAGIFEKIGKREFNKLFAM